MGILNSKDDLIAKLQSDKVALREEIEQFMKNNCPLCNNTPGQYEKLRQEFDQGKIPTTDELLGLALAATIRLAQTITNIEQAVANIENQPPEWVVQTVKKALNEKPEKTTT